MIATYHNDLGYLSDMPVLYLVLIVVGVPLAAAAAGWLPPAASRPPSPGPASSDRLLDHSDRARRNGRSRPSASGTQKTRWDSRLRKKPCRTALVQVSPRRLETQRIPDRVNDRP